MIILSLLFKLTNGGSSLEETATILLSRVQTSANAALIVQQLATQASLTRNGRHVESAVAIFRTVQAAASAPLAPDFHVTSAQVAMSVPEPTLGSIAVLLAVVPRIPPSRPLVARSARRWLIAAIRQLLDKDSSACTCATFILASAWPSAGTHLRSLSDVGVC